MYRNSSHLAITHNAENPQHTLTLTLSFSHTHTAHNPLLLMLLLLSANSIGRVGLHGNIAVNCKSFFWANGVISVLPVGRGLVMLLDTLCTYIQSCINVMKMLLLIYYQLFKIVAQFQEAYMHNVT